MPLEKRVPTSGGQWNNNNWHGTGDIKRKNGDTYKGQVWNGEFQGLGEYTWKGQGADGIKDSTYKGRYYKGKKAGAGDRIFHDGSRFRGDFFNDRMHGEGIMQYANGNVYVGEFQHDAIQGSGVMTYVHGARYEGQYKDGKPYGSYMAWHKNGKKRSEGNYKNGKRCSRGGMGERSSVRGRRGEGKW